MKDLKEIGFYTLSDERAKSSSSSSPLYRCELILTDVCNFKCPYCRFLSKDNSGIKSLEEAKHIVDLWAKEGLVNVRFSGGEPTTWKGLVDLVRYTNSFPSVKHIAVSTNGSASLDTYLELVNAGVNDFSISLDACCSSFGDKMAGNVKGAWEKVVANIEKLSKLTYITVGIVVTEETLSQLPDVIRFADSLGVSDIRIISAAQFNKVLDVVKDLPDSIVNKYPILKYRVNNIRSGRNVRGLNELSANKCGLVLDDMAIAGNNHYPCIIYLRENGVAIGKIGPNMRKEREEWYKNHNSFEDPICKLNCLDVCEDHNNKHEIYYSQSRQ